MQLLQRLEKGWSDGEGAPISPALIQKAGDLSAVLCGHGLPEPLVCPVPDGSLDLNWDDHAVYCTMSDASVSFTAVLPSGEVVEDEWPRACVQEVGASIAARWSKNK